MVRLVRMSEKPKRKKTVTGIHRTVVLRPEMDERLSKLLSATGLNRNELFRLVATRMTPKDVAELQGR